jgi:hypothetical protein
VAEKIVELKTFACRHNPTSGKTQIRFTGPDGEVAGVELLQGRAGVVMAALRQQLSQFDAPDAELDTINVTDLGAASGPNGEPVLVVHSERLAPLPLLITLDQLAAIEAWLGNARQALEGRPVRSQ